MILRLDMNLHDMPCEERVLQAIRAAFSSLQRGEAAQPPQCSIVLPGSEGDCIFYPGYVRSANAFGVKVSPFLDARKRRGISPVTAYTLLLNAETGEPELLVDSKALTTERTAATTLLAVDLLTERYRPSTIGIVGTGPIGRSHARYASKLFPRADVMVYSPTAVAPGELGEVRRRAISAECPAIRLAESLSPLLDCEVIMLCTSSGEPVIDVTATSSNCLITSVGTNLPKTHEINWRQLGSLQVFCDYRATCAATAGDMRLAVEHGVWSADRIIGDIPELLGRTVMPASSGRTYFRATGLALEDIAVAKLVSP